MQTLNPIISQTCWPGIEADTLGQVQSATSITAEHLALHVICTLQPVARHGLRFGGYAAD